MSDYSLTILEGRLGKDPEVRFLPDGKAVCSFSLATNHDWKGKDGAKETRTEWHNIVAFGKTAENCGQYLKKGSKILLDGEIRYESYEKNGEKKYITKIHAQTVKFLDGKAEDGSQGQVAQAVGEGIDESIPF